MANCINVNNDNFKDLVEKSGLKSIKLEVMMDKWMTDNNTEVWPTLEQLGLKNILSSNGIDLVFQKNKQLASIGTKEEYLNYLSTIFPNSKVKNIVWHAGSIGEFPEWVSENEYNTLIEKEKNGTLSDDKNIGEYAPYNSEKSVLDDMRLQIESTKRFSSESFGKSGFYGLYAIGAGFYFGSYAEASDYGSPRPFLINIQNPIYTSPYVEKLNFPSKDKSDGSLLYPLKSEGIDGVINDAGSSNGEIHEYSVYEESQIHYIGYEEDIDGFKKFIKESKSEPISDTEKVDEVYSPLFTKINDDNLEEDEDSEPLMDSDTFEQEREYLSDEEKSQFETKPFANLTQTLVYQLEDINNEIAELDGRMNNASKTEFKQLSKDKAKLLLTKSNLISKIKEAKQLNNLWQVVDFGNEAVEEVSKLMADSNLTIKGLRYAERIANFWKQAGIDEDGRFGHVLFGENGYAGVSDEIVDALQSIASQMKRLDSKQIRVKTNRKVLEMVRKQLGNEWTEDEIHASMKDISWMSKNVFAIADYGSPLLSAIYSAMKRVDSDSSDEISNMVAEFDSKLKAADKFLTPKNGNKYDLFYQEINGQLTGDMIKVYSKKYQDIKNELIDKAKKSKRPEDWVKFKEWSKQNEDYLDIRLLFPQVKLSPSVQKIAEEHKDKLIKLIGQKQFDRHMNQLESIVEMYNNSKMAYENQLELTPDLTESDKIQLFRKWEYLNSPFVELDRRLGRYREDGSIESIKTEIDGKPVYAAEKLKGLRSIPKAELSNGIKTEWYDKKYQKIAEHEETLDLYNYMYDMMDYMRSILPEHQRNHIGSNTMPFIEKSMGKLFSESMGVGMAKLIEGIQKSVIVNSLNETDYDEIDFATGENIKKVKVHSMIRTNKAIQEAIDVKAIAYEASTGIKPLEADMERFKREVIDEFNAQRSFDLPTVMKAYMATMITHKHKLNTIDLIEAARGVFENINETVTSNAGIEQKRNGSQREKVGLKNMNEVLNYTIDHFKNQPIHTPQGKMYETKTYTINEKSEIANLVHTQDLLKIQLEKGSLSQEEFDKRFKVLQDRMNKLGGYEYLSKYGEQLLKAVQIRGMGFNAIAGVVNVTTGWMENSIRAADGRFFDTTQLAQSYRDVSTTIADPRRKNEVTKKLVSIENRFRLVGDPSQELYRQEGKFTEIAYIITKKTEFFNVMAMAGAYLRNIPATNDKGEKSNLYEAFDENGKIKSGWTLDDKRSNDDFLFQVELSLHRLIQKSHGNYKDPLMAKKTIIGQMAMQFRTWMPEMFNSRWGKSTGIDPILKKEFKGRWRSISALKGGEVNGTVFSMADQVLYTTGQLLKKLAFQKTSFDGRMSEVDAANMKANLMELHFVLGMLALALLLKAAVPDEDKKKNFTYNMAINMILRQQNDIMVFANPLTFEQINKNVLPVMSILTDTKAIVKSVKNEFSDDERKSGKTIGKIANAIPGLSQGVRIFKYGEKEMVQQ